LVQGEEEVFYSAEEAVGLVEEVLGGGFAAFLHAFDGFFGDLVEGLVEGGEFLEFGFMGVAFLGFTGEPASEGALGGGVRGGGGSPSSR
jgi:hypothetical protein